MGSDQVWRRDLSNNYGNFFLDFLSDDSTAKRIAYAACWGHKELKLTEAELNMIRPLVQKFDAVSVRNKSAVKVCREVLGVNAEHVLDPALLLTKEDYRRLLSDMKPSRSSGHLLAMASDYRNLPLMRDIAGELGLPVCDFRPLPFGKRRTDSLAECIEPPVEEWLKAFDDAEFVVTDHFHGMVFALVFEKPFAVIPPITALERLTSLAELLGIQDRLLLRHEFSGALAELDYGPIREKLKEYCAKSMKFLTRALES